ncbi:hypothetical protein HDU88_001966 [Geranomyces variabilis]|nr:hypothetical protein HDU88_001966 [Geranomyces variabilis]
MQGQDPDVFTFLQSTCTSSCLTDVGVLTAAVLNFCVLGNWAVDNGDAPNAAYFDGWMVNLDPCSWSGESTVTCTAEGLVSDIAVVDGLDAGVPSWMQWLINLETFSIDGSQANMNDPPTVFDPDFWRLPLLREFKANDGGWDITIPAYDGGQTIPNPIPSLTNLVILDVATVSIGSAIAYSVLTNLDISSCMGSPGTGFADDLSTYTWLADFALASTLTHIRIENTLAVGMFPAQWGNLGALTALNMYNNHLSGTVPSVCGAGTPWGNHLTCYIRTQDSGYVVDVSGCSSCNH